jgi:FkbM family methyltransferase
MATVAQTAVIALVAPYTRREAPGWGILYKRLVGSYENNALWRGAGLRTIVGKRHGFLMELDISGWSERSAFFLGRWYDLGNQLLVSAVLKPGDCVIDVGGNIGMFTLAARALTGPEGRVVAFEPNPKPRAKFQRHIDLNNLSNIELLPYALHETEGRATLHFPKINTGEGSLSRLDDYSPDDTESVEVEIKVADSLMDALCPRLVKLDVEGAEIGVLKGMERLVARTKPIITAEYVPQHLARFGSSLADFNAFASRSGYDIYRLGAPKSGGVRRLALTPVDAPERGGDIVLVHRDDHTLDAHISRAAG